MILCRRGKAEAALQSLREIMGKLKLTVNEEDGEAVGDRLEGCAYGVDMVEPLPQAEVVEVA